MAKHIKPEFKYLSYIIVDLIAINIFIFCMKYIENFYGIGSFKTQISLIPFLLMSGLLLIHSLISMLLCAFYLFKRMVNFKRWD